MKNLTKLILAGLCLMHLHAQSEPITIETDEATITVVRPLDQWSGDKSALEESLEAHQEKTAWYKLQLPNKGFLSGNPNLTQSATNHPIVNEATTRINAEGFKLPRNSKNSFIVFAPVSVPTENIASILKMQEYAFQNITLANGDPDKLQSKTSRNKFFGGILALGATVLAADKWGPALGTQAALGSGLTNDIYKVASQYQGGMVPIAVGSIEPSKYTVVDLRRVGTYTPDRIGQVLIAYKTQKTEAIETASLIEAIVALTGSKTTTEQIQAARSEDLKARQAIWAECKAQDLPKCKD